MKRRPIGDILLEMGAIDEHQLQSALAHHRQWGMPLGRAVIEKRFASSEVVLEALSKQTLMPVVDLSKEQLDAKLASLLPKKVAEQHRAIPLRLEGPRQDVLVVAIAAPASLDSLDAIQSVSGKRRVRAMLSEDESLQRAFGRIYLGYDTAETQKVDPRSRAIHLDEQELELEPEADAEANAPKEQRPVLIYGWAEETGRTMALVLAADGISARVATAHEVLGCASEDVIVAPLPAMETIVPQGRRAPGRLVVAGKIPEEDLPRAQRLGARGFIVAPVDTALLIRAVRRCRAIDERSPRAA